MPPPCLSYVAAQTQVLVHVQNIKLTNTHLHPHTHKSQTPSDSSICSPYPLESAREIKRGRDGLRMLFQPFSFLDNLITSDRGDAARSALVQGHSLLGPRLEEVRSEEGWGSGKAHGQLDEV